MIVDKTSSSHWWIIYTFFLGIGGPVLAIGIWFDIFRLRSSRRSRIAIISVVCGVVGGLSSLLLLNFIVQTSGRG